MTNLSPQASINKMPNINSQAVNTGPTDFYLKGLSGEFKGMVFKLTSREIFIGREKTNHIKVVKDIKVSRKHARFIQSQGKLYIQNLSPNNKVKINNELSDKAELKNGYVVTIGDINLKIIADIKSTSTPSVGGLRPLQQKKKMNPIVAGAIVLVVSLGLYLQVFTKNQPQAKKALRDIATQESITSRLNEEQQQLEDLETEIKESEKSNPDYVEAQKIYIKGFRDFQKGIYSQAVASFETSLSLYAGHKLARRYKTIAQNRLDELIDFHVTEGRIHLENRKYNFCIAAFKNAMSQSYDKNDKRFTEAKTGLRRCQTLKRSLY